MTYTLYKRDYLKSGPQHFPIETFDSFKPAWAYALELFESQRYAIVGCHLFPEFPYAPATAEFFIVKGNTYRTYIISEGSPNV
jgi:hypothetical protein